MKQASQMPLDLRFRPALGREDFRVTTSNENAAKFIDLWPHWENRIVGLVGPERCGKSHIANVWQLRANAILVHAKELNELHLPKLLCNGAVILEGLDTLEAHAEIPLFHLLNLVSEEQAFLLTTMRKPPATCNYTLPDLRSRLRAMPLVALHSPDDILLEWVLEKLFTDRRIRAEDGLASYLSKRMERSWKAVERMVEKLDYASLSGRRRVGVPLARELLRQNDTAVKEGREET